MRDRPVHATRVTTLVLFLMAMVVFLPACGGSSTPATSLSTATSTATTSAAPSVAASATTTTAPSPTAASTATASPASTAAPAGSPTAGTGVTPLVYLDDRSTAEAVIRSYYNAINTKQYARAYSYWMPGTPASQLPPFDQFRQGYATTLSVDVVFGAISNGVAAGNSYYAVPVALTSKTSDKGMLIFAGCYVLHLGNPANYAVPPVEPMAIQSADVKQVEAGANLQELLAGACAGQPGSGSSVPVTPPSNPNDISANTYVDNRGSGVDLIRSLYNAINRKEYARAYTYWESNVDPSMLPPFPQFEQGYAQTASVALTFGTVTTGAGAGQRYESVPATIVATMTDGSTQTFVGCYVTHLASPDIQTEPPFHPMSIARGNLSKVANGSDTSALMASACKP